MSKKINLELSKIDEELLSELSERTGESTENIIKRALAALHNNLCVDKKQDVQPIQIPPYIPYIPYIPYYPVWPWPQKKYFYKTDDTSLPYLDISCGGYEFNYGNLPNNTNINIVTGDDCFVSDKLTISNCHENFPLCEAGSVEFDESTIKLTGFIRSINNMEM